MNNLLINKNHETPTSHSLLRKARRSTLTMAIGVGIASLCMVGCGSDGGSSSSTAEPTPHPTPSTPDKDPSTKSFSESATWTVDGTKIGDTCYDFDSQAEIDCTGKTWDIKFENQQRSVKLWTNSNISGPGNGAAFYLMPWSELATLKNAEEVPTVGFKSDRGNGVFAQSPWAEYSLNGQHKMAPNNRVYLVTSNASDATTISTVNQPVYAMQVINYYNEAGKSGYPTIRWIDTALPTQVRTKMIDASSTDDWVYVNLKSGDITSKDGDWHVGFRRYDVVLNGGASGDGKVGGYVAKTPAGYYNEDGTPIKAKFMQNNMEESLADLTQVANYDISADGVPWIVDEAGSELNPKAKGSYPVIDYGWYVYKGNEGHRLFAKPKEEAIGALIRSGEGNSYARMYLEEITYADANSPSPSEWVFKLEIEPATK